MKEVQGNLVQIALGGVSIAHCVSADFRIGAGVAKQLDREFDIRAELLNTIPRVECKVGAVIELKRRVGEDDALISIYNAITKETARDKPTYADFEAAMRTLRDAVAGGSTLAIPRMGCGIDGLEWARVKEILLRVFAGSDISLVVYTL